MNNLPRPTHLYCSVGKGFLSVLCSILGGLLVGGCAVTKPDIAVSDSPKKVTMGIDARDYNEIAKRVYDSLANSNSIGRGKVAALGPVNDNDCPYRFDAITFQEKVQVLAKRGGLMEFTWAVNAIKGNDAATERYKIMELQWAKESTVDPEELRTFGTLAAIDYLLFGRVSVDTAGNETVFRYNWKLGDCKTGLLVWTDEFEMTKVRQ